MSNLLFLTYQPLTQEGSGDIRIGQVNKKPVLQKEKEIFEKLGYVPYWAVASSDPDDLIVQSMFVAANAPFAAHLFRTDNYIRINKIEWYKAIKDNKDKNPLEFEDSKCDDTECEYLVKEYTPVSMVCTPMLLDEGQSEQNVRSAFMFMGENIPDGLKNLLSEYIIEVARYCAMFTYDDRALDQASIRPEAGELMRAVFKGRNVYEIAMLPVLADVLLQYKADSTFEYNSLRMYRAGFFIREAFNIKNRLAYWSYDDCSKEKYHELYDSMKRTIITNLELERAYLEGNIPYPNDICPCGSGKKYKKCHGKIGDVTRLFT